MIELVDGDGGLNDGNTAASKRKRQPRPEQKGKQAKLDFGRTGGNQLRFSDDESPSTTGREISKPKSRRKRAEGEEAERKAMVARNRAAKKAEAQAAKAVSGAGAKDRKGKGKVTETSGSNNAITFLSSSPIRDTSPHRQTSGSRSRASSTGTLPCAPESSTAHVSIVIDSDSDDSLHAARRKHPFFAQKTASGGVSDPILLNEDEPVKPKMPRPTDSRPAHSFFAAKKSDISTPMERQTSGQSKKRAKKEHAFFSSLGEGSRSPASVETKPGWGQDVKEGEEWQAPWPTVEGHQVWPESLQWPASPTRPSRKGKEPAVSPNDFWHQYLAGIRSTPKLRKPHTSKSQPSIPPFIAAHPAFRVAQRRPGSSEDWVHKYAPKSAQEVLGNEVEACYLRDWIHALKVGVSVPESDPGYRSVVRTVSRPTKRRTDDSWIAYDDDPVKGYTDDEEEQVAIEYPQPPPHLEADRRPASYPPLGARLTNTIVLRGPSGTGKTAAVYAAAHELGWDVFEVYPGIGKRNALSISAMVGEVSRSHMVAKGGRATSPKPSTAMIDLTAESKIGYLAETEGIAPVKARQSVILLEEVDILYDDDKNFWQAVVALIADSRRPVILTCNDLSLVPCSQLPLQAILQFQSTPSYLAIPYLETIAHAEGRPLSPSTVHSTIRHIPSALQLHQPLPPRLSQDIPQLDLRQAIHQLQLGLIDNLPSEECEMEELSSALRRLDNVSYADAWVDRRPYAAIETLETDVYALSASDEVGSRMLYKPQFDPLAVVLPSHSREADMAEYLGSGSHDERLRQLAANRASYMSSTLSFLDELVTLESYLLPTPCLFLDYVPYIRRMVLADDILVAADLAAAATGDERMNRRTGRPLRVTAVVPGRVDYVRYLDLSAPALDDARRDLFVE